MNHHSSLLPDPRSSGRASGWKGALLLGIALFLPVACGGGSGSSSGAEASGSAAEEAAGSAAASPSGDSAAHTHEGGETHTHGGEAHTHAAADTLDSAVPLAASGDGSPSGAVTVLARGDTLQLHVALEGAEPGSRYSAELLAGGCSEPGEALADPTPLMTGSAGRGSSQTTVAPGRTGGHAHGAVRVKRQDGSPVGCADVHLTGAHEHDGG